MAGVLATMLVLAIWRRGARGLLVANRPQGFGRDGGALNLRDAVDAMPEGLAFYDAQDRLMVWNAPYARFCVGSGPLWRGRPYRDILTASLAAGAYANAVGHEADWLEQRLARRLACAGHMEMQTVDGRWIRLTDRRTAGGGIVTVFTDITDAKAAEAAIVHARDEAVSATQVKTQFLANMSHEIRTPLNGVMGMNSLLLMTELTDEQRGFAETVQVAAEALMGLLNDILDISKLESGKVELEAIAFDLRTVVREVVGLLGPRAMEKGIYLIADCARASIPLCGDPHRIRQILLNLGSNAVKFTDQGSVAVVAGVEPLDDGRARMRVEVRDTGIGIAAAVKPRLFKTFQQADGSITRRYGGSGLGLSICRQLVEVMEGQIGVDDNPRGGSVFWFELVLPIAEAERRSAVA
jgi:signal transduction histidine kinase